MLEDLETVTARLLYVTNSLSFDAKKLVHNITESLLFKDVVIPIASFSTIYSKKNGKFIYINKDSLLSASPITCDVKSSQMAFHTVVDNAIKYSKKSSTIDIYGKEDKNFCKVIVDSYSSVTIREEEKEHIFRKYYRTKEVEEKKFDGSGIGLYLAQEIMIINGGRVLLTNLNNPTRFELHFKKYE